MSHTLRLCGALAVVALAAAIAPARANLIQNGNFAGGSGADWAFQVQTIGISSGAQFVGTSCPTCSPGATFATTPIDSGVGWLDQVDLGYGTLSQTFATTPGQNYEVSFLFGELGFSPGLFVSVFDTTAHLPSTALLALVNNPPAPADYLLNPPPGCGATLCGVFWHSIGAGPEVSLESFTGTATGNSTTLEFAGSGPGTNFIVSDVSVVAVPEPGTASLVLIGLLGFAVFRLRKAVGGPM